MMKTKFSNLHFDPLFSGRAHWLGLLSWLFFGLASVFAAYTDPNVRVKVVPAGQPTTAANQPILTLPSTGPVSATLVSEAFNFTPTGYTWSQIPAGLNSLASLTPANLSATQTSVPQVDVTLSATGVYQFQVTATDGVQSASRYVWVQVWDHVSALNPLQLVGKNPDIAPPPAVRTLSADPGPYLHPRLFFSRSDWPELSGKATSSTEVSSAITGLQSQLNGNFDSASGPLKNYATTLQTYAQGGYDASYYTNTLVPARAALGASLGSSLIGKNPGTAFVDALVTASYLAWIGTDPTLTQTSVPATARNRFLYLATLAAATAKSELAYNGNANAAYDMAIVYDLLYDWMTLQQRNDTRDYLYAIGYGRYNNGGGGLQKTAPYPMPSGASQNGDFPNLSDNVLWAQLVIEGEEGTVTSAIQGTYGPTESYATGPNAWPFASPAAVSNLHRESRWNTDYFLTNWGSMLNHSAYFELSMTYAAPSMLALARRGQNLFVTTPLYQASVNVLLQLYQRESDGKTVTYEHHEGGMSNGPNSYNGRYILQYMYPGDAMIDYVHRAFRVENINNLAQAIFGSDPTTQNLATVAQAKALSVTKLDPFRGMAVTRNSWNENDLLVYFETRPDVEGHMHAEANNFSLYALGRAWSNPPGYHCTINDVAATVLIQKPSLASDPATQGYIGKSPSSATQTPTSSNFPTPPGKLLEVTDDPAKNWTLFAGDATSAYRNAFGGTGGSIDTGTPLSSFFYNGVMPKLSPELQARYAETLKVQQTDYNPVSYALRSVLTVRGTRPYVLVIDDITADGVTPRNYRWSMPCATSFGSSGGRFIDASGSSVYTSLALQSGATATEAVAWHSPVDDGTAAGKPRLLIRDVTEQSTSGQPPIFLDKRLASLGASGALTYGYDNNSGKFSYLSTNRVMIQRNNVVSPNYKVLLFPYRTGETAPATSWNADQSVLTVNLQNNFTDQLTFDKTRSDHRTRMTAFSRTLTGRSAPTLQLPADLVLQANTPAANGQPGAPALFAVTAANDVGATLLPAVSSPSGTVFPIGVNMVSVTATDSQGQIRTGQFKVTVIPSPPQVTVQSVTNLPGGTAGIKLSWTPFFGATAYSVKRATVSGGPYTVISDRQNGTSIVDTGLSGTGYYYVVTAWLNDLEGQPCAELSISGDVSPFTGQTIGTAAPGYGFYRQDSSYLLTVTGGGLGGSSDHAPFVSIPWNGDGSFTSRLVSVTGEGGDVSQYGNFGIVMRQSTAPNDLMVSSCFNPYVSPVTAIWRSAIGSTATKSGPFTSTTLPLPIWLRLVRSGSSLTAFYSFDGAAWTQTAAASTVNFTGPTLVGLAAAGQNTTRTSALFDNVVFLSPPRGTVQPGAIGLAWDSSPSLVYSVERATSANGPFMTLATGLSTPAFTDSNVTAGTTYYYTVSTSGALGGSTVSAVTAVYFPTLSAVPTGFVPTPSVGQIALSWDAAPAGTNSAFSVQRATSASGPFITLVSGLTSPSYVDTGAGFSSGVTYFYRIVADNGLGAASSETYSASSLAGTFTKANNTVVLDSGSSWAPMAVPGPADTVLWNGTYTNGVAGIGTGLSVAKLQITSPSTGITLNSGTGPLTLGAGGMDLSAATQNLSVNAPVALAADQTWTVNTGRTLTVAGAVADSGSNSGNGGLTKSGAGNLTLAGTNTYTGRTTVNSGLLIFNNAGNQNLGALDGIVTAGTVSKPANSGTLSFTQAASTTYNIGTITNSTTTGVAGAFTLNGGLNSVTTIATVSGANGSQVIFAGDSIANTTINNQLSSPGQTLKVNAGTVTITQGRNTAPNIEVNGGSLIFSLNRFSTNRNNQTLKITSGLLQVNANSGYGMRLNSDNGANGSGVANNTFTGTQIGGTVSVLKGGTIVSFNLGGTSSTQTSTYNFSGGVMSILGAGTDGCVDLGADLAGTSTTAFNMSGGKLLVSNTILGAQGAGAKQSFVWTGGTLAAATYDATNLTSSSGTAVNIGVTNTLTNAGGILAPGDIGTGGRTTITGSYSVTSANASLAIDLGSTTIATAFQNGAAFYDTVALTGALTLGGSLNVSLVNGFGSTISSTNTFNIFTGATSVTGAFTNVDSAGRLNLLTGGSIAISNTTNNVTIFGYNTGASLIWAGDAGSNAWDVNTTANSTKAAVASVFNNGDVATFNNSGLANNTINLNTTVSPSFVTFANTFGTYTVTGSGKISGPSILTKTGAGTLILATANDYSGTTTISAGTLQLGSGAGGGTTGSLTATTAITNNGNLTINRSNAFSQLTELGAGMAITGTGSFTQAGAGTTTLTAANSYSGVTTVNNGSLIFNNAGNQNLGALDGLGTVSKPVGSGMLSFTQAASTPYNIGTIINSTTTGVAGAFTLYGGLNSVTTIATVNGATGSQVIFGGNATGTVTISNTVNTAGQTVSFNGGTTNLNGSGAYGSSFIVNGGTVNTFQSTGNGANFNNVVNLQVLSGTFNMRQLNGLRIGNTYGTGLANGAVNASIVQSGGISNYINGGIQLGSAGTTAFTDTFAMSGGTISLIGGTGISIGAGTSGGATSSFNFSGGKIVESGTISGAQGAGAQQSFVWTGGTLATATYDATKLTSTQGTAVVIGTTNTLTNAGGILAPGDIGTGGRTVVTGNYSVTSAAASYAVDLGSTTAATAFQSGAAFYDQTTVSGTVALGGNLSVTLRNGFTPANSDTFTILNSTGALSGAFTNAAFNQRIDTAGGEGTFLVTQSGNTVRLSAYTVRLSTNAANTPLQTWRYQNFGTIDNSGDAADTADPDGDGFTNLVEFAYGLNPLVNSSGTITISGSSIVNRGTATVSLTNTADGVNYFALFGRRKDYLAAGLTYTVQFSADLTTWQNNSAIPTVVASDDDIEAVTVPYPFFLSTGATARFFRLDISTP